MGMQTEKVRFNVGGKIFETTATTLASVSRNSITGDLYVPPHIPDKLFYREALYYGLFAQVKAAKFFEFHSNRLKLTSSVRAIRASPDGGCAVAHGSVVRIYDWMLEEHQSLNLDYRIVNDTEWIDSENLVMSVCQGQNLSWEVGGIGVVSSSTGKLRHRFQLNEEKDKVKGFDAGALCFNSDNKIFASSSGKSNKGLGVWDQVTGKLIGFFDSLDGLPLHSRFGKADKIQWLNGIASMFWIFRDKRIVWSWSDDKFTCSSTHVVDAIPLGETNSICVVRNNENLGFLDFRNPKERVRWNSYSRIKDVKNHGPNLVPVDHPKLMFHEGQLFCSIDDDITVYHGGSIRDFSIGGDRLFALHSEENVFDRDSGRPSTPRKDLQIWAPLTYLGFLLVSISIILESLEGDGGTLRTCLKDGVDMPNNDVNAAVGEGTVPDKVASWFVMDFSSTIPFETLRFMFTGSSNINEVVGGSAELLDSEGHVSGITMITFNKVRFNVRGKIFETTATTLASVSRNSMLGAMLDEEWNLQPTDVNKDKVARNVKGPTEQVSFMCHPTYLKNYFTGSSLLRSS
ncbi:hypothetical protein C5167_041771 [Papaver somniferum]|nr:hypothetical protein C5167_041771 [Papaver somniferum]